ncbi:MAG: hypothetical protein KUL80_08425 [Comamonas sp.]|nr:hypothetical protein [Comamonas sp.]
MGNERRNWHRRWIVDLAAATASHDSGLTVAFTPGIQMPRPECGTYCSAEGVGEWTGAPARGDDTLRAWLLLNPNLKDPPSINSRLGRLMEEAGRVWARANADAAKGRP